MKRIPSLSLFLAFTTAVAFANGKPSASDPNDASPVPQTNNNPPQVPNQQEEYFLPSGTQNLNRANAAKLWASPFPPPGVPWCCCCCEQPIPLGPPQPPPPKGPPGKPAAVPINVKV